jgi:hypothetical protein
MVKQFLVFLVLGHLQVVVDIFFLLVLILFLIHNQRVLFFQLLLLRFFQWVLIDVCRLWLCLLTAIVIHFHFFISILLR